MLDRLTSRFFARSVAGLRNARWRRPKIPRFRYIPESRKPGAVWILTPDWNLPSGGIRKQYRSVDVLNGAGVPAAIVHHSRGFRCDWFENQTRVMAACEVILSPSDVVVVPEIYGASICDLPSGVRQVILNQNAYITLAQLGADNVSANPYVNNPDLIAVATVSHQNTDLLRYAFPGVSIHRITWALDSNLYFPGTTSVNKRIAYMPRRRASEAAQVLALLRLRGILKQWEVVEIGDRSERQVAEIMRSSRVFLSFSQREGLGLPPLEAIACGCLVVGFTGYAGVEYFQQPFATAVEDGDVGAFAAAVEQLLTWSEREPLAARQVALDGSRRVLEQYTAESEKQDLIRLFEPLLQ